MGNGGDVLDRGDFDPGVLDAANGGVTARTRALHLHFDTAQTVLHRGASCLLGGLHPKFGLHSNNAKVRSGVGLQPASGTNGARLIFLTTETGSTFYDFATVFRDLFNCPNALFLDGAISKMYLKNQPTAYTNGYFGPLLAVVPKNSPRRAPKRKARPKAVAPAPTSIPAPAADPFAEPAPVGGGKPGRNKAPAAPAPLPVTPAPADSVVTPPRRP